ncbi:DDE-type integrase/transposase/recombinase [Paraburkholderia tropica]|uniref:DDE-type integrase/transposase/recombinase n=1 Tax=Paraburkholderia tropica TaxID=92647 RepID=UPI0015908268|nr:DDE-type integrase/transposase/recombinase [Paraburkholderia tropica]
MPMKALPLPELAVGNVLKERAGKKIFVVLKTGANNRWTHIIDIEHETRPRFHRALPFKMKTDDLRHRLSPDYVEEDALEKLDKSPISPASRRRAPLFILSRRLASYQEIVEEPKLSKGWLLITGLLGFDKDRDSEGKLPEPCIYGDEFEELLHKETRRKRVLRYCAISTVSEDTVYRTFRRYCQRGLNADAVADDYDLSGGRGEQREWMRRPGRNPWRRKLGASPRGKVVKGLLALASDYYFSFEYVKGKRSQKTYEQALAWVRVTFLRNRAVYNERGEMVELKLDSSIVLTRRQLQYYIHQSYTYEERRIHRVGRRRYLLHERPLTGSLRTSRGPGERFHIDATVLDVYLVGQILRTKVIGRPVLYLVIDDYSGMAVGFFITYDPPCWDGAMMALVNAISPKVAFCRTLDIDIREDQWPAHRLCETLYADQGEVSSVHKAHPLFSYCRMEVQNAPAYRPDLRSVMERRFGIIPAVWNSLVPGIVEKSSFDRGVRHPAYDAALDIRELSRVICIALLHYNNCVIRGYPTPPEMIERGLAATPLNLWKYGMEVNGCGRSVAVDEFRAKVMPRKIVPIDGKGILHNGLHYKCPTFDLLERQAMFRAEGTETEVEISYDSTDNSSILLFGLGEPISCAISEHDAKKLIGVTYKEQSLGKDLDATNRGMTEEANEPESAMTYYNISKIGKDANSKTAKALREAGMSRPDINDMDEMRKVERSADPHSSITQETKAGGKPRRSSKAGASFKKFIKSLKQEGNASDQVEQEKYDEEGDAYEQPVADVTAPSSEADHMTSRERREMRTRALLAEMDK